ncbi:hypothetical protein BMS3Abin16_01352 [archaeon BMS3Abin16]|nr:hypothetical protein BMS3Abin16_01352 [archaeon BMS3Abin16]
MSDRKRYLLLILIVTIVVLIFYSIGEKSVENNNPASSGAVNLSNYPTGTPRPQISRLISEALKRRPKPTLPPNT